MTDAIKSKKATSKAQAYLTADEAANYLRVSAKTLERWRVEGSGPQFFKAGPGLRSRVLYKQSDLQKWVEGFAYSSTSEYS